MQYARLSRKTKRFDFKEVQLLYSYVTKLMYYLYNYKAVLLIEFLLIASLRD